MGLRLSRGPRPRPAGRAQRLAGPQAAPSSELVGARPDRALWRQAACGPPLPAASCSTRSCCAWPRRWSRSEHLRAGRRRSVEVEVEGLATRQRAEVAAGGGARGRAAHRRRRRRTSAPPGWRASGRCVPSASRRKAPSTPVKPLGARQLAPPCSAAPRAPARQGDRQAHRIVGEAGDARRRLAVALGVLLREVGPAARIGRRIPGADQARRRGRRWDSPCRRCRSA